MTKLDISENRVLLHSFVLFAFLPGAMFHFTHVTVVCLRASHLATQTWSLSNVEQDSNTKSEIKEASAFAVERHILSALTVWFTTGTSWPGYSGLGKKLFFQHHKNGHISPSAENLNTPLLIFLYRTECDTQYVATVWGICITHAISMSTDMSCCVWVSCCITQMNNWYGKLLIFKVILHFYCWFEMLISTLNTWNDWLHGANWSH